MYVLITDHIVVLIHTLGVGESRLLIVSVLNTSSIWITVYMIIDTLIQIYPTCHETRPLIGQFAWVYFLVLSSANFVCPEKPQTSQWYDDAITKSHRNPRHTRLVKDSWHAHVSITGTSKCPKTLIKIISPIRKLKGDIGKR